MVNFGEDFSPYGNLGLHGVRLPKFVIDKKYYKELDIDELSDNSSFLRKLCNKKFVSKGLNTASNKKDYIDRVRYEIQIFEELGFVDYVLLIWDIINFCHENDIPVGPGRGSAAGSLVLFLIGVTNIDPIKNGLFFERFVSKTRAKKKIVDGITYLDGSLLPDVDSDICYYKRHKVIEYIQNKFKGRTCKILTINTLSGKLVFKEVVKTVLEYSEEEVKVLAGYVEKVHGVIEKLSKSEKNHPDLKRWLSAERKQGEMLSNQEVFNIAKKIENLPKNFGVHPSALAISYDLLENTIPIQLTKVKNEDTDINESHHVSGFDMNWVAEYSVKVDVLGLRSVSIVDEIIKMLKLDLSTIDLSNPEIYKPLQDLKTPHGIFQIEANTQYRACRDVKPNSLEEVSDLMALARPGAMDYIKEYVENKGGKHLEPINEELDKILGQTKHVALYQEQMMSIAHKVFGFTLEEAETLRRIVGKKKVEEMPAWKDKVYAKAKEKGLAENIAAMYWKILDDSSNYSFNKCLSLDTMVETKDDFKIISDIKPGEEIYAYNAPLDKFELKPVKDVIFSEAELYEITFENGLQIKCSMEHKFLCKDGKMRKIKDIIELGLEIVCKE